MVDEESSNSAVNLVGFFLEFAEKLLAPARSFVDVEGMPKRVEHPFLFRAPEFSGPAAIHFAWPSPNAHQENRALRSSGLL